MADAAANNNEGITLRAGGPRERVTAERVQEALERWQGEIDAAGDGAAVIGLDVSCAIWDAEMWRLMQGFLEQHVIPTIRTLKIDDIIASLPTDDGLEVFEFLGPFFANAPNLVEVNLEDNAMGIRAIERLEPLFRQRSLEVINLCNCGLSAETAQLLSTTLNPNHLRRLKLGRNQMGVEGARHFGNLIRQCATTLIELDYDGARALSKGTLLLCTALQGCRNLQRLNLNDNDLNNGDDEENHAVHALVTVLQNNPNLVELYLPATSLQPAGTQLILDAIGESGAQLTVLELSAVELEQEGPEILTTFFDNHPQPALRELRLEGNQFEAEGLENLAPFLRQLHTACPQMELLDLRDNLLDRDAGVLLLDNLPAPANMTLRTIMLQDNELSVRTAARLQNRYPAVDIQVDEQDMLGEDPPDEQEDEPEVDDLAAQLEQAQI